MTKRSETSLVYSSDATIANGIGQKLQPRVKITTLITLVMCVAVLRRGITSDQITGFHKHRRTVSESFLGTRTVTSHILVYALRLDKDVRLGTDRCRITSLSWLELDPNLWLWSVTDRCDETHPVVPTREPATMHIHMCSGRPAGGTCQGLPRATERLTITRCSCVPKRLCRHGPSLVPAESRDSAI
jgi:hypothetical protein